MPVQNCPKSSISVQLCCISDKKQMFWTYPALFGHAWTQIIFFKLLSVSLSTFYLVVSIVSNIFSQKLEIMQNVKPGSSIKLKIAVSRLTYKYITKNYKSKPFRIDRSTTPGLFLLNALRHKTQFDPKLEILSLDKYPHYIEAEFPESQGRKYGKILTVSSIRDFNEFILAALYEELFNYVEALTLAGTHNMTDAIFEFREKYLLSENEFSMDRSKKAYYRYRKAYNTLKTN